MSVTQQIQIPERLFRVLFKPRSIVELRDEARLFSDVLKAHKAKGDELDAKEIKFLDVFSKMDELCAVGVGNLKFD